MHPDGKGRNRQASPRIGIAFNDMGASSPQQRPWWPASALGMADVGRGPSSAAVPGSPKATYSPLAYAKRQRAASSTPQDAEEGPDDDDLSDLLDLALSKTSSNEADANNLNMETKLEFGKTDTSESATFANLHGSNHVGLQPKAQPLACTNLLASTGLGIGLGGFGIRLPGNIAMPRPVNVAQDSESDDVPLVSKRAAGSRSPDNANVVVCAAPGVTPHLIDCSTMQQHQQQAGSPVLAGVAAPADAAAGSGGGGLVSMLAGVRSESPPSCFRPHPAWAAEAGRLLYVAVFLTQESRDVLLAMVPPLHRLVTADHMTLAYKPLTVQQLLTFPLGASVQLSIIGAAADSRAQAVAADPPSWLPPTASASTHVTISVALGAKAVEAGHLIRDALQLAAIADPAGPVVSGAGTFQHFEEPLQLVGRLGVRVALPSGEAVVMYNVDELAAGGHVSLCSDDIDTFYAMHGERVKRPLQQQPSPTSCLDLPSVTVSASSSSGAGNGGGSSSPFTAAALPEDMPPLQLPPALISTPMDATNSNSCRSPSFPAVDAGATAQQQLSMPPAGPCAGAPAEQLLNNGTGDCETSSSSDSDSDIDAVQFRSAVHVGDYVALRPFVPTGSGEVLLQGYVREFACEEAFQGNGVMVVLTDNTIGFVVAVLDPAGGSSSNVVGAGGSSSSSNKRAAMQPKASTPNKRKQKAARKKAAAQGGKLAALDAAASETADVLSEWAMSQHDAAQGGVAATPAAGLGVRNAADAAHDMHLWDEFVGLQRQHGEGLCGAILRSCDHDFVEAIATIKAQAAGFSSSTSSEAADGAAAAVPAAGAAAGPDDDLVVQLALSLGLPAESALALCRLVPHVAAEAAVEALQQHSGDANKAQAAAGPAAAAAAAE
ncbi:hypothetical protein COO60DRAFT_130697 [Scenedesmus sp. NREL 46B-D3]|nr:hypothetical protein COO60DRAFT_130697 [Scenedesmus sp. NREL 46B-D3]